MESKMKRKHKITLTFESDIPDDIIDYQTNNSNDLRQLIRYMTGADLVHVKIDHGDPVELLNRKLTDLTLGELFTLLDFPGDVQASTRQMHEAIMRKAEQLLADAIDMEKVTSQAIEVTSIKSIMELEEVTQDFRRGFETGGYAGATKLLLLHAWATE